MHSLCHGNEIGYPLIHVGIHCKYYYCDNKHGVYKLQHDSTFYTYCSDNLKILFTGKDVIDTSWTHACTKLYINHTYSIYIDYLNITAISIVD